MRLRLLAGLVTGLFLLLLPAPAPAAEVVLPVPGYGWYYGCGPTAVGMVVGYYDGLGWATLVDGDASYISPASEAMIASTGHIADYALPKETSPTILPDKSLPPAGDEHPSDCIADFAHASWAADGLHYGQTVSVMLGPSFIDYVQLRTLNQLATYPLLRGPRLHLRRPQELNRRRAPDGSGGPFRRRLGH